MASSNLFNVCGMVLDSEIPLVGALPAVGCAADAVIRFGTAPDSLASPHVCGDLVQATETEVLFRIPDVATYWIRDGREVVVEPAKSASETDLRLFLGTSAIGALIHQRGMLPLHASAVSVGDGAIGFLGNCGAGKSTLAAMLGELGFSLFADDVVVLQQTANACLLAHPGFLRLKLCDDSLRHLEVDQASLSPVRAGLPKYELPVVSHGPVSPLTLRRLYVIEDAVDDSPDMILPVREIDRLKLLFTHTYRSCFLVSASQRVCHFQACAEVVRQVPMFRFIRKRNLDQARNTTQRLAIDFSAAASFASAKIAA